MAGAVPASLPSSPARLPKRDCQPAAERRPVRLPVTVVGLLDACHPSQLQFYQIDESNTCGRMPQVQLKSRAALRAWLATNHRQRASVWLITDQTSVPDKLERRGVNQLPRPMAQHLRPAIGRQVKV